MPPVRRFDWEQQYLAGRHDVAIDLQDLAAGNSFAPLDLTRVQSSHLVVAPGAESRALLLHRLYLE